VAEFKEKSEGGCVRRTNNNHDSMLDEGDILEADI
jgi:hypothetical protein